MVNDNVQNAGLNMPEYMYQKQEKPIQLITLLADGSSSQNQPVAGPGSPMRIDLLNEFFQRFITTLAKDDDVNEQVRINIMVFNHEVESVLEMAFMRPRDITIPVIAAKGGTDMSLATIDGITVTEAAYQVGKTVGNEHYRPRIVTVGDFEDNLTADAVKMINEYNDAEKMLFDGFSTIPLNTEDPYFREPAIWCLKEAIPDEKRRLAVRTYNDLADGYQQYADLTAMAIRIRTRTGEGEKPVILPEEDPFQRADNKLIVPHFNDLI